MKILTNSSKHNKNSLPVKVILQTLPSSGIRNYIQMQKDNILEKQQ